MNQSTAASETKETKPRVFLLASNFDHPKLESIIDLSQWLTISQVSLDV